MEERRKAIRWEIEKPVRFRVDDDILEYKGISKDISEGGLCVYTAKEFVPATPLDLEIELPDDLKRIFVRGKVAWSKRPQIGSQQDTKIGINFLDLKTQDAQRIFKYAFKHQHDKVMQRWWQGV